MKNGGRSHVSYLLKKSLDFHCDDCARMEQLACQIFLERMIKDSSPLIWNQFFPPLIYGDENEVALSFKKIISHICLFMYRCLIQVSVQLCIYYKWLRFIMNITPNYTMFSHLTRHLIHWYYNTKTLIIQLLNIYCSMLHKCTTEHGFNAKIHWNKYQYYTKLKPNKT